jgi:hypothetical protein
MKPTKASLLPRSIGSAAESCALNADSCNGWSMFTTARPPKAAAYALTTMPPSECPTSTGRAIDDEAFASSDTTACTSLANEIGSKGPSVDDSP